MHNSQSKLSEREIAQAWAQITVKLWRKNLDRLKVGKRSSGELYRSFQYKVISTSGGNVDRIEFAFKYYGKFLDMGVGRGTRLGDRPVSRGNRKLSEKFLGMKRVPKKWYSRTFFAESHRLGELLRDAYGQRAKIVISESISDKSNS